MPDISKIQLPGSNTVYNIKDEVARSAIAAGFKFLIAWSGDSTPDRSLIPDVVTVYYNNTAYTGTLTTEAAEHNTIYLIRSTTELSGENDYYDEDVTAQYAGNNQWEWEKLGDTQIELSNVVTGVTLNRSIASFVVDYPSPATTDVIGKNASLSFTQPTISVSPDYKYIKPELTFTNRLVTTSVSTVSSATDVSVPNITGNTSVTANKSTWSFTMGTGTASETLIISGGNGSDVTASYTVLGTANTASKVIKGSRTVASGQISAQGTGATVATSVNLAASDAVSSGSTRVVSGISSASASGGAVTWTNRDEKTVLTGLGDATTGTGLASLTSITVTKGA